MKIDRTLLPLEFKYNAETMVLDVTWADGSIIRYFEIDSRAAFLNETNARRNYDWFCFLNFRCDHNPFKCDGQNFMCPCPSNLKSEVIREATNKVGTPQARPLLVYQQNRGGRII